MIAGATLSSLARRAGHAARALLARRHGAPRAEELPFFPWESAYPPGVDWHAAIPIRPVFDLLDDSAAQFPDHRCIDFLGKDYSYREVHALADRAAKGFQALGLGKGARVALFLPNSPYYVIAYYGLLKAGCVAVNVNPLYGERGIVHVLADSEAEVVVTLDEPALYRKLAHALPLTRVRKVVVCAVAEALPFLKGALWPFLRMKDRVEIPRDSRHVGFRELIENDGRFEPVDIRPREDLAALQYTGGIDGRPKGAMLSHANLYANAVQTAMWVSGLELGRERILAVLPFTHAFGMTVAMNTSIHIGAELVVLPRFEPGAVLRAIERRRVTLLTGVPAMFGALGAHRKLDRHDVSSVKLCVSGGAPLTAAMRRRFERPTGLTILEGYGLTEGVAVATCNPATGANKEGSIGLPFPGTVVVIERTNGLGGLARVGEIGEICLRGPQVMQGYWRQPEATARVLRSGRLLTGDLGFMDEEGYTHIVGRSKDLILVGGYNVYPSAVETAILMNPCVAEVAVCGVPDVHRGEMVAAFVVLREGASLTTRELKDFLRDKLASFELPRRIAFRPALPLGVDGKVAKAELAASIARKRGRAGTEHAEAA